LKQSEVCTSLSNLEILCAVLLYCTFTLKCGDLSLLALGEFLNGSNLTGSIS